MKLYFTYLYFLEASLNACGTSITIFDAITNKDAPISRTNEKISNEFENMELLDSRERAVTPYNAASDRTTYKGADDISYEDLKELKVDCYPRDSCIRRGSDDSETHFSSYSCNCDRQCSTLGTCCIDSPYRENLAPSQRCKSTSKPLDGSGYYMVDKCPKNMGDNIIWKDQCESEKSGGDILRIAPVTSLETNTTYKSYYCLRCHESSHNFLYWKLSLKGDYQDDERAEQSDFAVTYNQRRKIWQASLRNKSISFPLRLKFLPPKEMNIPFTQCDPRIISDCSKDWTDESLRDKCLSYSAILYGSDNIYKNAHCAMCNHKTLDGLSCERPEQVDSRRGDEELDSRKQYGTDHNRKYDRRGPPNVYLTTDSGDSPENKGLRTRDSRVRKPSVNHARKWYDLLRRSIYERNRYSVQFVEPQRRVATTVRPKKTLTFFCFSRLLNVDYSASSKLGKLQGCPENYIWDPYRIQCRKLVCAHPGRMLRNGKCVSRH